MFGEEVGRFVIGEQPAATSIEVDDGALFLGLKLQARLDCQGGFYCSEATTAKNKSRAWSPPFDLDVTVRRGQEMVGWKRCEPDHYGLEKDELRDWVFESRTGWLLMLIHVRNCDFELPAAGAYEVEVKMVPKAGVTALRRTEVGDGEGRTTVEFTTVEAVPTAYKKRWHARGHNLDEGEER